MKLQTILLLLFVLAGVSLARAHAFLDHAEPRVGSMVHPPPPLVKIWFTEELEPAFSRIRVFDSAQKEIDRRDVKIDSAQPTIMTVSLPKLAAGDYEVVWDAVAIDTHHTHGTFKFTVTAP